VEVSDSFSALEDLDAEVLQDNRAWEAIRGYIKISDKKKLFWIEEKSRVSMKSAQNY
jgi:hypothetical protein